MAETDERQEITSSVFDEKKSFLFKLPILLKELQKSHACPVDAYTPQG